MFKRKGKLKKSLLALPILLVLMCGSAFAQVSVYAEGAYTDTDLKVYIYADVTAEPIISFGVKLTYDDAEVSLDEATCLKRNDDAWYFGDPGGTTYDTPNAGPVVTANTTSSNVVFVGGKIDSTETTQTGVGPGDRILLGVVTFSRNSDVVPTIGLALGKDGDYENFVELDGGLLDSTATITGSAEIHERGDANGDGRFTGRDINTIKSYFGDSNAPCWVDCNDDGRITGRDINCVKAEF
nr:dockerin type I domain-containing protein [uncultured Desulfobacter sp.]